MPVFDIQVAEEEVTYPVDNPLWVPDCVCGHQPNAVRTVVKIGSSSFCAI